MLFRSTTNVITLTVCDIGVSKQTSSRTFTVIVTRELQATIARLGTDITISADATPGRTYRLEYKDSLDASPWLPLGADVVAAATTVSFTDAGVAGNQRFYRVVLVD